MHLRHISSLYSKYQAFQPFTDQEAWMLFKLAAFGEAIGWTLLIGGILTDQTSVSWHEIPVKITGQLHGMLFMVYIAAVLVLSPSLKWSLVRTVIAGLVSVPPYGSLLFELYMSRTRLQAEFKGFRTSIRLHLLMSHYATVKE